MEKKMIEYKGFGSLGHDAKLIKKANKCMATPAARGSIKRKIFNGFFDLLKVIAQRIGRMLPYNHGET